MIRILIVKVCTDISAKTSAKTFRKPEDFLLPPQLLPAAKSRRQLLNNGFMQKPGIIRH